MVVIESIVRKTGVDKPPIEIMEREEGSMVVMNEEGGNLNLV